MLMAYLCSGYMQEANNLDTSPPVTLKAGLLRGFVTICCAKFFTIPIRPTCVRYTKMVVACFGPGQDFVLNQYQTADAMH